MEKPKQLITHLIKKEITRLKLKIEKAPTVSNRTDLKKYEKLLQSIYAMGDEDIFPDLKPMPKIGYGPEIKEMFDANKKLKITVGEVVEILSKKFKITHPPHLVTLKHRLYTTFVIYTQRGALKNLSSRNDTPVYALGVGWKPVGRNWAKKKITKKK